MEQDSAQKAGMDSHLGHDWYTLPLLQCIATTAMLRLLTPCNIFGRICLMFTHYMHIYLRIRCLSADSSCPFPVIQG